MESIDFKKCHSAKLLIAVAFHYREDRLVFLADMLASLLSFPVETLRVVVMTNTDQHDEMQKILDICHGLVSEGRVCVLQTYPDLSNPLMLTWCFKEILENVFTNNRNEYTHFIYLEDDIKLSFINFCYFLTYRDVLKKHNLIPAFVRVEFNEESKKHVSSDNWYQKDINTTARIEYGNYYFVDLTNPYMAMFILDRELADEYLNARSSDFNGSVSIINLGVREQAAMGLMFENVPVGFMSRYVVPVAIKSRTVLIDSWIYHLPNSLANCQNTPNGKLPMSELIMSQKVSHLRSLARKGDIETQKIIGDMYNNGIDVPRNHLESIHWYLKAANQGDHAAQLALGVIYAYAAPGVQPDYVYAYMWSKLASKVFPGAKTNMSVLETVMDQEQIDRAILTSENWTIGSCAERQEQYYPWYADKWWTPHMEKIKIGVDEWNNNKEKRTEQEL
ncbi:MAG: sel1 repeat family protein [Magnetococcus sp. YQC-3]